ncbi:MAG: hypothetical protein MUE60_02735 [Candidatus Eisenbacteria bacterium]|jgi:DNA-binding beta-propeller fold protein YncE|nr:hypothetical protein [Candidatus Eisenbacteria bacterium]
MLTRLILVLMTLLGSASGQMVGALDFEVRAALDGVFTDISVGTEGRIYLLDAGGEAVTVHSADLQRSLAVYDLRNTEGKIGRVVAMAAAADGSFWVVDQGGTLARFDALGRLVSRFVLPSKGGVTLERPTALGVAPDGTVAVTDGQRKTVIVLDPDGTVRTMVRGADHRGITFGDPIDVAMDRTGYVYVVDGSGGGVCKIDAWGVLRHRWPAAPEGPTPLRFPRCMASDDAGLSYVADSVGRCVVMVDTSVVAMFGTLGRRPGQLQKPVAMAVTASGDVAIVDADPPRVQVFGMQALQEIRRGVQPEERFLPVRVVPIAAWRWGGGRIALSSGRIAVVGSDRKTVAMGMWADGPEGMQPLELLAGRLKAVSDVAVAPDARVLVADEGARAVLVVDPQSETVEPAPSPLGNPPWKSPARVAWSPAGEWVVWDKGYKALAFVGGSIDRNVSISPKDEVVDMGVTAEGEVYLFFGSGPPILVKPDGLVEAGPVSAPRGMTSVAASAHGFVAALEEGGFAGITRAGELLYLGGVRAGSPPLLIRAADVAMDDSLVVALTADGDIHGFVTENLGRAGLGGVLNAERPDSFALHLDPVSAGGRTAVATVTPGRFFVGGLVPGLYRWRVQAPGWLTAAAQSPVWLKDRRVAELGSVSLSPAGGAVGHLSPGGIPARVHAMRGDSVVATAVCDGAGRFVLGDLTPGQYRLAVDAPGFKPDGPPPVFEIEAGGMADIPTLRIVQLGGLIGYVKPIIPDQEVWLLKEGRFAALCRPEPLGEAQDEPDGLLGRFECAGIEPGVYSMVVRTRGFYPDTTLPPVTVLEGQSARCGTAILAPAPSDSAGGMALQALDRAMEDYSQARFSTAQEAIERLVAGRQVPASALDRAYMLLGWCALARGPAHGETARASFRLAFVVNPRIETSADASPTVTTTIESVRRQLFGDAGPPAGIFTH